MSSHGKEDFSSPSHFIAGNVKNHVKDWKRISSDRWLLNTIQGVEIPFIELPVQEVEPRPYKLSEEEVRFVDSELEVMVEKGIIERTYPAEDQVVSNIFLRPKKDGSFRFILDLTWVNTHVQYEHFKMHSLNTALEMMRPQCWMGSVDLKDAYYTVPIMKEHRKFLRFRWAGELFQFAVLPNGLACAPRIFTKLLNPVFAKLREEGHECFQYIDDSFVVADSEQKCRESLRSLSTTLGKLGFLVHEDKSVMDPSQRLDFLGFRLDSNKFKVFLTLEKEGKLTRAGESILGKDVCSIRELAGFIGLTIAFSHAFRYGPRHTKCLEIEKVMALKQAKGNFDAKLRLSVRACVEIRWWLDNVTFSGRKILEGEPDQVLFTDASTEGWGAHVGAQATGGRWTQGEKEQHINVLELKAIEFALKSLCDSNQTLVKVFTDNTTALAYVRNQGGVKSPQCNEVAQDIWEWCEQRDICLSVAHIPGIQNELADFKSRNFADNIEWALSPKIFEKVVSLFGEPEVDLFATRLNNKVGKYVSWKPDPNALAIDAFALRWTNIFFYAFPPFSCVGRTVQKILEEEAHGILLVPWWPGQPWWGRLIARGLRRLQFRRKKGNLIPQGSPENELFLSRSPLGAFLF